jgi:hypothetical protein
MPTTIKLKNSVTTTNAPSSLVQGEVAINITDKKVWVGNAATTPVQLLGTGATGNFSALTCTTLTASGATTFTAGTASTSTTTGTAVITGGLGVSGRINAANFDGIVGANTAAAGNFTTLGATGVATFSAGTVSAPAITTTGDTNTGIFFPAADTIAFTEGGVESMRIDASGNVGIGAASPAAWTNPKLYVKQTGATPYTGVTVESSSNGNGIYVGHTGSVGTVGVSYGASGSFTPLTFDTSGTERMRIDSSGNVGIGTSSPATKAEISGTAASANIALRITNTDASGYSTLQMGDGNAGIYRNGSSQSGYAGTSSLNLITVGAHNIGFSTQNTLRAIIDSSGNVGIGTSSPQATLDVSYGNASRADTLRLTNTNTAGYGSWLNFYGNYNGGYSFAKIGAENDGTGGSMRFHTADTSEVSQERMRIDSSGNLLFNSGYGSVATAYGCRAWVNFNGTGTVAIRASGNVSSITDNGTGQYTINFSTAMPDVNYATSLAGQDTGAGSQDTEAMAIASGGVAAGSVGVTNIGFSGSFTDLPTVCVAIFR